MNRAERRAIERACAKRHLPKTDGSGEWFCARCLTPLSGPVGQQEDGR